MKRFIAALALIAVAAPAVAKDVTIGLSWDARESALNQAWEDYMRAEAKKLGDADGINVKWVVNMANNDASRQASNIEDLINSGVDIIIARALRFGGDRRVDSCGQGGEHSLRDLRQVFERREADRPCGG